MGSEMCIRDSVYVAPRTAQEAVLCGLYAEVTGVERVGIHDSFFSIGGHSLLAMKVIARLRDETGCSLPLRALFDTPSPEGLGPQLLALEADVGPVLIAGPGDLGDGRVVLSYGQQRLWALDRLEGASDAYNMPLALRLRGGLDIDALRSALCLILERHTVLRTVIVEGEDGLPEGRVLPVPDAGKMLPVLDLSTSPDPEGEAEALIEEEATHPFDLGVDLPLRGRVLCVGDDDYVLMLTAHHHAFDGLSEDVLCGELNTAYAAYSSGGVPSLPPLVVQYSDWAAWQRLVLADGIEDKVARARDRLADSPDVLTLPVDYPRRVDRSRRAGDIRFRLPASLVSGLEALAVREGTTLFTVMLAAYGGVLSRLSGQDDVVTVSYTHLTLPTTPYV